MRHVQSNILIFLLILGVSQVQAQRYIDSLHNDIKLKQDQVITLKGNVETLKFDIKTNERLINQEETRIKNAAKIKKEYERQRRKDSLALVRERTLEDLKLTKREKIDSIANYVNRNILDNETSFKADIRVNEYCSVTLNSKKDDYYFNLFETIVDESPNYKFKQLLIFNNKTDLHSFSIHCYDCVEECLKKNGKYLTEVDQTLPFISKSSVRRLLTQFEILKGLCINPNN